MESKCCVNQENVDIVREELYTDTEIAEIADLFKSLGDPTRMRIVAALRIRELCVGDLSALMEISQSGVSHQLRLLKQKRIVKSRRDGKLIMYSLDDQHVVDIIKITANHVRHEE